MGLFSSFENGGMPASIIAGRGYRRASVLQQCQQHEADHQHDEASRCRGGE